MNVLGLIPARGGSTGIPRKNLTDLDGRPLIEYTIDSAKGSSTLTRLLVSSDDKEIKEVARQNGVESPFTRPASLADHHASAEGVIYHAVEWLSEHDGWDAEIVVYLQPTSPLRSAAHIDDAVNLLLASDADTVVSVVRVPHSFTPSSLTLIENDHLVPYAVESRPMRRQDKPVLYARNGPAVLALRYASFRERRTLYGARTVPLVMSAWESMDIDEPADVEVATALLRQRGRTQK